jgi:hypothetical protein
VDADSTLALTVTLNEKIYKSVMRIRNGFNAVPDTDPAFFINADPDTDPDPDQGFI